MLLRPDFIQNVSTLKKNKSEKRNLFFERKMVSKPSKFVFCLLKMLNIFSWDFLHAVKMICDFSF